MGILFGKSPQIFVDNRFVSDIQMCKYWKLRHEKGWRIRITHETVFSIDAVSVRLVAFYLMDYGDDQLQPSEEFSDVIFIMPVSDFLDMYEPIIRGG